MRRAVALTCAAVTLGAAAIAAPTTANAVRGPATRPMPPAADFQRVPLNEDPGEPMALAVLPDRRVLHSARTGQLRVNDPRTGLNTLVADFREAPAGLYQHDEEGLQGIAVDPNFAENRWVYVYYSPALNTPLDDPSTPLFNEGDAPMMGTLADFARFRGVLRLSRFKMTGNTLDFGSEQRIIDVPTDRGLCCHVGGKIDFDSEGNLYLSTGDDTNPFFSEGYTPINDNPTGIAATPFQNPGLDARRTSGNTNDLRGKVLRIRVGANGGYTVPEGNLFRQGTPNTRPEIYVMGLRNPFRFAVDRETDQLLLGDYSPDAPNPNANRGPQGLGRWMVITEPANYGWPYCMAPDIPYRDYTFPPVGAPTGTQGTPGEWFNCGAPVNDSAWNADISSGGTQITFQGQRVLPPVQQPQVWYDYGNSALFPEVNGVSPFTGPNGTTVGGNGVSPMGGPMYHFSRSNPSQVKWPEYYDDAALFYEWSRDYIKEMRINSRGDLIDIRDVGPVGLVDNPMDMEFGPDGALYVLDYGDGYFSENPEAQLARIDFTRGNRTPTVRVAATPSQAPTAPLTVTFSSAGTSDPDGDRLQYQWDFNADGIFDSTSANPTFTYSALGIYDATLKVTDRTGRWASSSVRVRVGNAPPTVQLQLRTAAGAPLTNNNFRFGDAVQFTVNVTDDQPVDCTRVQVAYILGHDAHGHPQNSTAGCTGTIQTPPLDSAHATSGNIAAVFVAQYTDNPPGGQPPQTGSTQTIIRPPTGTNP
ncbi:PQQ-dependent sugar dehydrogenase [Motilibacter aurantiacus]|uniref:PQQ-dependent sugar dehydrogenase n=1 Tax=Motilibacter aurantiacus TaxID=2714955 RepID=UPI00140A1886|nr:PKD domain-containing protein [Motilibacter aurantiacus]